MPGSTPSMPAGPAEGERDPRVGMSLALHIGHARSTEPFWTSELALPGYPLAPIAHGTERERTLLVAGLEQPDGGYVSLEQSATIGYLPQGPEPAPGRAVAEQVRSGISGFDTARQQVAPLRREP